MHLLSCRSIILLILLFLLLMCAEAKAEPSDRKEGMIGDQPGGVSSWSDYRGAEFNGYAGIGKSPLWLKIVAYVDSAKLIGDYDMEALGQLWIAELHQKVMPIASEKNQKLLNLQISDLPNYLNLSNVLPQSGDYTPKADVLKPLTQTPQIKTEVSNMAIELIRCYSKYYAPIKKFGAFRKRDQQKRDAMEKLVGSKAVAALEEDYLNGGSRLKRLTAENLSDFIQLKLTDLQNHYTADAVECCLKGSAKDQNLSEPSKEDALNLSRLWNVMCERQDKTGTWFAAVLRNPDRQHKSKMFYLAIGVTRYRDLLRANLPYEQPAPYPPGIGDFPHLAIAKRSNSPANIGEHLDKSSLGTTCELTKELIFSYLELKERYRRKSIEPEWKNSVFLDWTNHLRLALITLVGEDAVKQLEDDWTSRK